MTGSLLSVLLALALSNGQSVNAAADQKCNLSGRVTNALTGEPLTKAKLHLTPDSEGSQEDDSNQHAYVELSNADGSFQFTNIEAGSYRLEGDHLGFLDTTYGAQRRHQAGTTLILRPGETVATISLALRPEAVISGLVVDEDGDPVASASVALSSQTWINGQLTYRTNKGTMVDDRGEFRLGNLEPGKYILSANELRRGRPAEVRSDGKPVVNLGVTFYPAAASLQSATPIALQAGQQVDGIEIRMRAVQTFHIRGKIAGSLPGGASSPGAALILNPEDDNSWFFNGFHQLGQSDSFDLPAIAPGKYRLTLVTFGNGKQQELDSETVTVDSSDVDGLVLNVHPAASLRGQMRIVGAPEAGAKLWNPADCSVALTPAAGRSFRFKSGSDAKPKADGTFVIDNVATRIYNLRVSGVPQGAYLESVRLNGDERVHKPLDFSQGVSGELLIVFRYGAAQVTAKTQLPASQSGNEAGMRVSPPMLALAANPPREDGSGVLEDAADPNGLFTFKNVAPGKYEAFAFEAGERGELQNPAILKAIADRGEQVELKAGERKQVEVRVISAADMQQVLRKLGFDAE